MNDGRSSAVVIVVRMFCTIFLIAFACSIFWNSLSGRTMLSLEVAFWVAVVLTVLFLVIGWVVVTVGGNLLLGDDRDFKQWKDQGGRPYLDSLPSPINPDSSITKLTGLAEPQYTDFVPPSSWRFQCPACGARVEKKIDVCWRCSYGRDGDSTAYHQRWGMADSTYQS